MVFEAHNLNKKTNKEIFLRLKGLLHFDSAFHFYMLMSVCSSVRVKFLRVPLALIKA